MLKFGEEIFVKISCKAQSLLLSIQCCNIQSIYVLRMSVQQTGSLSPLSVE
jgi:hypothetical protein